MQIEVLFACRTIRALEESENRQHIFGKRYQHPLMRCLYNIIIFDSLRLLFLLIFAVLKNSRFFYLINNKNIMHRMWGFYTTKNGKRQMDYLLPILNSNGILFQPISFEKYSIIRCLKLLHWRNLKVLCRLWRVLHKLRFSRKDFLIATRISIFLVHYVLQQELLRQHQVQLVIVSNDHSSEPLGIASAARSLSIPVCYIQHAQVSYLFPRLRFDLSILDNQVSQDVYAIIHPNTGNVVMRGILGEEGQMKILDSVKKLGLCLTNYEEVNVLKNILMNLRREFLGAKIFIRQHPASTKDLRELLFDGIELCDSGDSLNDFAKSCDLVIAGSTSSHLEILKLGTPTVFLNSLDIIDYDYYGFVKRQIVPGFKDVEDIRLEIVKAFYESPNWINAFQQFDAAYKQDRQTIDNQVKQSILNLIL